MTPVDTLKREAEQKAALEAAAPDLLEAVRRVRSAFLVEYHEDGRVMSVGYDSEALRPLISLLDAAIAKATGETR